MKILRLSRVEATNGDFDLGSSPAGYMTENGDFYTYDGIEVIVRDDEIFTAYDEEGEPFKALNIKELIEEADFLEAWEEF